MADDARGWSGKAGEGVVRDAWSPVARARDLKSGKMRALSVLGEAILVGRTRAGGLYALRDVCPHRASRLSTGKIRKEADGRETIECPYHAWRFHTDGVCAAIPTVSADDARDISKVRVKAYPLVEARGLAWIWISSDPRFEGPPPVPSP